MSADADPHYQKLYGRVTDVCSNRRGQPSLSAMKEPRPGRNPSVIRFASPSGKYEFRPDQKCAPFWHGSNNYGRILFAFISWYIWFNAEIENNQIKDIRTTWPPQSRNPQKRLRRICQTLHIHVIEKTCYTYP